MTELEKLESLALKTPRSWLQICEDFDPYKQTWIVADLQSKMAIQQELFKKFKILPEQAVLRASEFWLQILKRTGCEWTLISTSFARAFLIEQLEQETEPWLRVPGAHKTLMEYIQQLLPILLSSDSGELFENWLQENPNALIRWGRWYYFARKYVELFISRSWLLESWAPHILLDAEQKWTWDKQIIVDLGTQLTLTESLLFKKLAKIQNVHILYPISIFESSSSSCQRVYQSLDIVVPDGISLQNNYLGNKNLETEFSNQDLAEKFCEKNFQILRFSTSLSEIKDLCGQLRFWLEEGALAHDIAIYVPDIETYWPVLAPYLQTEGIPVQKNRVVRAHSFLPIMTWISKLKIEMSQVTSEDLELEVYSSRVQKVEVDYSQFKKMYSLILSPDQVSRLSKISGRYHFDLDLQKPLRLDEFLLWAIPHYKGQDSCLALEPLLHNLLGQAPTNTKLQTKSWLLFFEEIVSKTEIILTEGDSCGVVLENIKYSHRTTTRFCYLMGLSETQMSQNKKSGLSESERSLIERDLGYVLSDVNPQDIEFDASWIIKDKSCHSVVSFSQTGFSGEPDSPSSLWLKLAISNNRTLDKLNVPRLSRWDYIQQTNLKASRFNKSQEISKFIDRDLGDFKFNPTKTTVSRLSVSRLERYNECSLIFFFESLMKLKDQKSLDLDIDSMDKGQLQHKVLQNLIEKGFNTLEGSQSIVDETTFNDLIEKSREELGLIFFDERSWKRVKANTYELLQRFLDFEIEWQKNHPVVRNLGCEIPLKAYWNQENKDFQSEPTDIEFNGFIDRVDGDNLGNAVVLDYKSSANDLKNYPAWKDNNKFQLPVYSYLLEKGFGNIEVKSVLGMGYFVLKDLTRNKGLWCEEGDGQLFSINKRSRNSMSKSELNHFWEDIKNQLHKIVSEVQSGKFVPEPRDTNRCEKCNWRQKCRAPHLM